MIPRTTMRTRSKRPRLLRSRMPRPASRQPSSVRARCWKVRICCLVSKAQLCWVQVSSHASNHTVALSTWVSAARVSVLCWQRGLSRGNDHDPSFCCAGLLHVSRLGGGSYVESAESVLTKGDRLQVRVVEFDGQRLSLSLNSNANEPTGPMRQARVSKWFVLNASLSPFDR